jgi:hypothetical protein
MTGANTMRIARVVFDEDAIKGYLLATPDPARTVVQRMVQGESPRDLLLDGEVSPGALEDILADVSSRGAVLSVEGTGGSDLTRSAPARALPGTVEKGRVISTLPDPSPLPASELVARELDEIKEPPSRHSRPSLAGYRDEASPISRPLPPSASPSSLEDAVIRAMSESSPSKPPPPSSEQPPMIEPSELRPRSNPPDEASSEKVPSDKPLPSLPPDAIVPGASSGEIPAAADTSRIEPFPTLPSAIDATEPVRVAETTEPIRVADQTEPIRTADQTEPIRTADQTEPIETGARTDSDPVIPLVREASIPIVVSPPPTEVASKPLAPPGRKATRSGWTIGAVLVGAVAIVVLAGTRWFPLDDEPTPRASMAPSEGDVTYGDLPAGVSVPDGQGLLEIAALAGQRFRVDGTDASRTPDNGTVRLPMTAGTHMVRVGPAGSERLRIVQVQPGHTARVSFDEP